MSKKPTTSAKDDAPAETPAAAPKPFPPKTVDEINAAYDAMIADEQRKHAEEIASIEADRAKALGEL